MSEFCFFLGKKKVESIHSLKSKVVSHRCLVQDSKNQESEVLSLQFMVPRLQSKIYSLSEVYEMQ